VRRAYILFTLLIVLSVGCAEIPELFRFCDDVSNDFVETVAVGRAKAAVQTTPQEPNCASSLLPRESNICRESDHSSPQRSSLSGQELLLLLSIHRK
jgi:hypothetical protein